MKSITIFAVVNSSLEKAWEYYVNPEQVVKWNHASEDWHCPSAENDLKVGGKFNYVMASKNKEQKFNFSGVYTEIMPLKKIAYTMDDGRKVEVGFEQEKDGVKVKVAFEMETENSEDLQRSGWQAILDNYKKIVEA